MCVFLSPKRFCSQTLKTYIYPYMCVSLRASWIKLILRWVPQYSSSQGSRIDSFEISTCASRGGCKHQFVVAKCYMLYCESTQQCTAHETSSQVTRTKQRNTEWFSHVSSSGITLVSFSVAWRHLVSSVTQTELETVCETIELSPTQAAFPKSTSAKLWLKLAYLIDLSNTKIRECYSHSWNLLHASTKTNEDEDDVNHP